MTNYIPDNWVIIKVKGDDQHYRVLAGWSGGYTTGNSWRMNSGIKHVDETANSFIIYGVSGSSYDCSKESYGLRMNTAFVWTSLQKKYGDKVELMDENTDWVNVDWLLK